MNGTLMGTIIMPFDIDKITAASPFLQHLSKQRSILCDTQI
jgi:hypothetical protein